MERRKILVADGTKSGSTEEIGHMIAATLREDGFDVDVRRAAVRDMAGYAAVVLDGALYAAGLAAGADRR